MTIFGKILLVFNLLAGGAFAYFAMQDYFGEKGKGGRQAITAAMLRHIVLVDGLPLGGQKGKSPTSGEPNSKLDDPLDMPTDPEAEIPFTVVMGGGFRTDTISKPLLESYWKAVGDGGDLAPGANGTPEPNQLAELKRLRAKLEELLNKAETPAEKLARLNGWLLYQSQTYDERLTIQNLTDLKNSDGSAKLPEQLTKNVEELQKLFNAKFAALSDAPKPADAEVVKKLDAADAEDPAKQTEKLTNLDASRLTPQDEGERRTNIAHFLVHLSQDALWQKRVMVVVGLRHYAAAIAAQVERFADMTARVRMLTDADQPGFESTERNYMRLAIDRTELAARQAVLKRQWEDQKTKEDNFVSQRTTQLNAIKAELKKMKTEVDELLVKQTNIETGLFEVQREVAVTLDEVYQLELKLVARERDLLGLPPKAPAGK